MAKSKWFKGPIWREVEKHLRGEAREEGEATALQLYRRMERLLQDGSPGSDFLTSLSLSQYNSMRIIQEWWTGSIEEDK